MKRSILLFLSSSFLFAGHLERVGTWGSDGYTAVSLQNGLAFCAADHAGLDVLSLDSERVHRIGHLTTPGNALDLVLDGTLLYLAAGEAGVHVIDIEDPSNPHLLATHPTDEAIIALVHLDRQLYILGNRSLSIVDVSHPRSPTLLESRALFEGARDLVIDGSLVTVVDARGILFSVDAGGGGPLVILDKTILSDGGNTIARDGDLLLVGGRRGVTLIDSGGARLTELAHIPLQWTLAVAADAGTAVAAGNGMVIQIDTRNPTAPVVTASSRTANHTLGIALEDNRIAMAQNDDGLAVLSAHSGHLEETHRFDQAGSLERVSGDGRFGFLVGRQGFTTLDLSDPSEPIALEGPAIPNALSVLEHQSRIFVGGIDELFALQPDRDGTIASLERIAIEGAVRDIAVGEQRLWLSAESIDRTISIIGVDLERGSTEVSLSTPGSIEGLTIAGDLLVVADGEPGICTVDISSPDSPRLLAQIGVPGSAEHVAVREEIAYVAMGEAGLALVDLSAPTDPRHLAQLKTRGAARRLALSRDRLYLAGSEGISIWDVRDPAHPELLETVAIPGGTVDVAVAGDLILAAGGATGRLTVFQSEEEACKSCTALR